MVEEQDPFAATRMTLGEHLDELRTRLIRGIGSVLVIFIAAYCFLDPVTAFVSGPYTRAMARLEVHLVAEAESILDAAPERPRTEFFMSADPEDMRLTGFDKRLNMIGTGEGFLYQLKTCFYVSLVLGAPILLWQMWQFIAAGLYHKERRTVMKYFPFSLLAFGVGITFGFSEVVPAAIFFLNKSVSIELGTPNITAQMYLTFLSGLCLVFGFVFQLPLVLTFLGSTGIVDPANMAKFRGHFAIGAFVVAAMLTPPDPFTQLMMGVPVVILYEIGIWGARFAWGRREPSEAGSGGT